MYRELKFKYTLNEATGSTISGWESELRLASALSPQVLAIVNSGDNDKWQLAQDSVKTSDERSALSELFLIKTMGNYLPYLTEGRDIVISWVNQLGFKKINNPYLEFIPKFFSVQGNANKLTRDGIIVMNDMYANELVDEADMMGTGKEGMKHIIFDGGEEGLYHNTSQGMQSATTMLQVIDYYNYLSNQSNVIKLNLGAIVSYTPDKNPYVKQENIKGQDVVTLKGIEIDNNLIKNKEDWNKVRDAIIYKEGNFGALETFYWIDTAMKLGSNANQQSANKNRVDEIVNNIKDGRYTEDELKQIFDELKSLGYNL